MPVQFEYEISLHDFADAQLLYLRSSGDLHRLTPWLVVGVLCLLVGLFEMFEKEHGASALLLAVVGIGLIWSGISWLRPGKSVRRVLRKSYESSGLEGLKRNAEVTEDGFTVTGDNGSWKHRWEEVSVKAESKRVFIFYAQGGIYIFAKRYLRDAQQEEIRKLGSLGVPG